LNSDNAAPEKSWSKNFFTATSWYFNSGSSVRKSETSNRYVLIKISEIKKLRVMILRLQ